jgi:WD40 repeat protein
MDHDAINPFVGAFPFNKSQREYFFGREREYRELLSLLIARRIVLLHSPSGAGKTSLIQAKVVPGLQEANFKVLPTVRLALTPGTVPSTGPWSNRYLASVYACLKDTAGRGGPEGNGAWEPGSLADLLDRLVPAPATDRPKNEQQEIVLIVDQFEECLTCDPTDLKAKRIFFDQLGEALTNPRVWALFAIREDFVAALTPFVRLLPTRLNITFRLDFLGPAAASDAIRLPIRQAGCDIADETVDRLVRCLARFRLQVGSIAAGIGEPDERDVLDIEPVLLQVVCERIWNQWWPAQEGRRGTITNKDVGWYDARLTGPISDLGGMPPRGANLVDVADVDGVLHIRVYDINGELLVDRDETQLPEKAGPLALLRAQLDGLWPPHVLTRLESRRVLAAAAPVVGLGLDDDAQVNMAFESYFTGKVKAASQGDPRLERRIRDWIDRHLITSSGARGLILSEDVRAQGLSDDVVRRLVDDYLIRSETRRDQTYYELAHDRLIEPIRKNNREWFGRNQSTLISEYNDAVAASSAGDQRVERALRDWFDRRLVTASGDRDWVRKGTTRDDAATNALIEHLTECSLLHVIPREGELWYELRSDRLIQPILAVNVDWRRQFLQPFQLRADQWYREYRRRSLLLRKSDLEAAETWVKTHDVDCLPWEKEFLKESREAIIAEQRALNQNERQAVIQVMDGALLRALRGDLSRGLLDLAQNLEKSELDESLEARYRAQLWSWGRQAYTLQGLFEHEKRVMALAFSPDGKWIVTGSDDGTARLWEVDTGRCRRTFVHENEALSVAFVSDGHRIVTACLDGSARIWGTWSGDLLSQFRHDKGISSVAISADGAYLLTGCDDCFAWLWDVNNEDTPVQSFAHDDEVYAVALSPDGRRALTGGNDRVARLWDVETGKQIGDDLRHERMVLAVAFNPADARMVATGSWDRTAVVWDTTTGKALATLPHPGRVRSVVFAPDGSRLLTGDSEQIARFWDVSTREVIDQGILHLDTVYAVAFAPDGKSVATGCADTRARLWRFPRKRQAVFRHRGAVTAVRFGPRDGQITTGSWDHTSQVWATNSAAPIGEPFAHDGEVIDVAISPDQLAVLTASDDNTAKLWDVDTHTLLSVFSHDNAVSSVAFSPDGTLVLTASSDGTAQLWDREATQLRTFRHERRVPVAVFNNTGSRVATASEDSTARVWDSTSGELLHVLNHEGHVYVVKYSGDGKRLVTGGDDRKARVWDAASGELIARFPHHGRVLDAAFSPDGQTVLTGGADGIAQLWSVGSSRPTAPPLRHDGHVGAAAFSPDGRTVLTGSRDHTARLWDVSSGEAVVAPFWHHGPVIDVAFSPCGRLVLTGSSDGTVRLWDMPKPIQGRSEAINFWARLINGMSMDERGSLEPLSGSLWNIYQRRLRKLGGPPSLD